MKKAINSNVVAANAFLTTQLDALDVEQIKWYVDNVREKTNYKTDLFVGGFDINSFIHQYDFAFNMSKDTKYIYLLSEMKDKKVLKGYFRQDLPDYFIEILKEIGTELLHSQIEKDKSKPVQMQYYKKK